jgi:hypothetical protein
MNLTEPSLLEAVPHVLRPHADNVLKRFLGSPFASTLWKGGPSLIMPEGDLILPSRVYFQMTNYDAELATPAEHLVAACILTRNHDGWSRQRALTTLLRNPQPWISPYILRLSSEYVIEILDLIEDHMDQFSQSDIGTFIRLNPAFYQTMKHRIVSYWDCYYRSRFPKFGQYVGYRLIQGFDKMYEMSLLQSNQ